MLDPSPFSLLALAGVLHSKGYGCVCARDGGAAIQALDMGTQDLLVCDVGDDAAAALATIEQMRSIAGYEQLPAVLIADSRWAGLEKKAEAKLGGNTMFVQTDRPQFADRGGGPGPLDAVLGGRASPPRLDPKPTRLDYTVGRDVRPVRRRSVASRPNLDQTRPVLYSNP